MEIGYINPVSFLRGKLDKEKNLSVQRRQTCNCTYMMRNPNPNSWENEKSRQWQKILAEAAHKTRDPEVREYYRAIYEKLPKDKRPARLCDYIRREEMKKLRETAAAGTTH